MCILDGGDRNWRVSMGCRRHRGLFAEILSGLAHQRQPDIGMGKKEGLQDGSHRVYIVRVHFAPRV